MKTADLYIRVSTDEQADIGYSQRAQHETLQRYCLINSISVRKVVFEDHSAKTFARPAWDKLLCELKKSKGKSNLILFTKWDRFSRNAGDAYQMINTLRKLGVEPQAVEQPLDISVPENKMMLAFYLAAPEVENDRRALNVFHGMRRAKKEGRWMGSAPKGYINKTGEDGRKYIEPKEPEASIMRWAFEEIAQGQFQVDQIRKAASEKGLVCCKSNFWELIHNPVYCGKIAVPGFRDEEPMVVEGLHKPIISESLFYRVQDAINARKKKYAAVRLQERNEFPLRGFLICPNCGRPLTASISKGRQNSYSYYHCQSPCKTRFDSHTANELFRKELEQFVLRPSNEETMLRLASAIVKQHVETGSTTRKRVLAQLEKTNLKLKHGRELLLDQKIEPEDFKQIKSDCLEEINRLELKLETEVPKSSELVAQLKSVLSSLCRLNILYNNGTIEQQRQIIGSIFPEKLCFDGTRYRTARINSVILLLFKLGKGFSEIKKRTNHKKMTLSVEEVPSGFEPL